MKGKDFQKIVNDPEDQGEEETTKDPMIGQTVKKTLMTNI